MTSALAGSIDALLDAHYGEGPVAERFGEVRDGFRAEGYAEIEEFVPEAVLDALRRESFELIERAAVRRELFIPITGSTPRFYSNVNRDEIDKHGALIPEVYRSGSLRRLLSAITGDYILSVPYQPEEYLISRLHRRGDTHGWHWDDYTYALVCIIETPHVESGGSVQFVQNVDWNKENPDIEGILRRRAPELRHPKRGSAYLLKSDTALHRVTPLEHDAERVIICYSFGNNHDLTRPVSHETMEMMYPETCDPSHATRSSRYGA